MRQESWPLYHLPFFLYQRWKFKYINFFLIVSFVYLLFYWSSFSQDFFNDYLTLDLILFLSQNNSRSPSYKVCLLTFLFPILHFLNSSTTFWIFFGGSSEHRFWKELYMTGKSRTLTPILSLLCITLFLNVKIKVIRELL